jgi:protoheme ferro-lyase
MMIMLGAHGVPVASRSGAPKLKIPLGQRMVFGFQCQAHYSSKVLYSSLYYKQDVSWQCCRGIWLDPLKLDLF